MSTLPASGVSLLKKSNKIVRKSLSSQPDKSSKDHTAFVAGQLSIPVSRNLFTSIPCIFVSDYKLKKYTMQLYKNLGKDSGVHAFEIGLDFIQVRFSGASRLYTYSYSKAGAVHVEQMKLLALNGQGLNSYINRHVKYLYD
jgi:hypothetical protein